jgi:hypothetical protein
MRFKIKEKIKEKETFIIFPQYCGNCNLGFYLQSVPIDRYGFELCPICKEVIWNFKESAFSHKK